MFWKLCKFEWKSSYRLYVMFYAILLACSIIIGMSSIPDIKPSVLEYLIAIVVIIYTSGIFAIHIITVVFIFRNYIQTMYKRQSYLTHTLPVATWQLQLVKLLSALLWLILTFLVTLMSFWIMMLFAGSDVYGEIFHVFKLVWDEIPFHYELLLSLLYALLEIVETISLVYFVINLIHSIYIQRSRTVIAIVTVLALIMAESFGFNLLNDFLGNTSLSYAACIMLNIGISIVLIALWNYASVYLLDNKMEVE